MTWSIMCKTSDVKNNSTTDEVCKKKKEPDIMKSILKSRMVIKIAQNDHHMWPQNDLIMFKLHCVKLMFW